MRKNREGIRLGAKYLRATRSHLKSRVAELLPDEWKAAPAEVDGKEGG